MRSSPNLRQTYFLKGSDKDHKFISMIAASQSKIWTQDLQNTYLSYYAFDCSLQSITVHLQRITVVLQFKLHKNTSGIRGSDYIFNGMK